MKYRPEQHIIGKVYDLTQENMNAMIRHIEDLQERIETFRAALGVEHDHLYPAGQCYLCDILREDYKKEES